MDAVLNACWALISLAGLCLWVFRWFRVATQRQPHSNTRHSFLYLVCFLLFLFPSISASDDLLVEQTSDDSTPSEQAEIVAWEQLARAPSSCASPAEYRSSFQPAEYLAALSALVPCGLCVGLRRSTVPCLKPETLLLAAPRAERAPPSSPVFRKR